MKLKTITMAANKPTEPTGFITFGPKDAFFTCVQICYTPTQEQIENLRKFFGLDYITMEEYKNL